MTALPAPRPGSPGPTVAVAEWARTGGPHPSAYLPSVRVVRRTLCLSRLPCPGVGARATGLRLRVGSATAPPVIAAIIRGVQLHLLDLLGLEPTHPRWPET
jgi:hypothetical protein